MDRYGWSTVAGLALFFVGALANSFVSAQSLGVRFPILLAFLLSGYAVNFLPKQQGDSFLDWLLIRFVPIVVMLACLVRL